MYDIDNVGGLYWCFTDLSTVNYFISAIILKCDLILVIKTYYCWEHWIKSQQIKWIGTDISRLSKEVCVCVGGGVHTTNYNP